MHIVVINAALVAPQAWRNGGGQTRELLAWPADADWRVRISRADIAADGPFSAFPQVERWFTVLQGAGVVLTFPDGDRALKRGDVPLCFDGAAAPGCRLIDGPTQDLNLMVRQGTGVMRPVQAGRAWDEVFQMRGIYTTTAGLMSAPSPAASRQAPRGQTHRLGADTLLWMQDGGADRWSFQFDTPAAAAQAWWLGFTPED